MNIENQITISLVLIICVLVLIPVVILRVKSYRLRQRLKKELIETGKQEIKAVLSKKESKNKELMKYLILGIAVVGGAVLILHFLRKRR